MPSKKKIPCKRCYIQSKNFSDQQMMEPTDPTSTATDGYGCPNCGNYLPKEQVGDWLGTIK